MHQSRGFTLIEVLVVIVVIALLVSISALNSDTDPRDDIVKNEASRIKFYLESITDQAIINSKNIGIQFNRHKAEPYVWGKTKTNSSPQTGKPNNSKQWAWSVYNNQNTPPLELNHDIEFNLFINDSEILLDNAADKKEEAEPQLFIESSGIQTLIKIQITLPDYSKHIAIKGNGAGRYKVGGLTDAFQ